MMEWIVGTFAQKAQSINSHIGTMIGDPVGRRIWARSLCGLRGSMTDWADTEDRAVLDQLENLCAKCRKTLVGKRLTAVP